MTCVRTTSRGVVTAFDISVAKAPAAPGGSRLPPAGVEHARQRGVGLGSEVRAMDKP